MTTIEIGKDTIFIFQRSIFRLEKEKRGIEEISIREMIEPSVVELVELQLELELSEDWLPLINVDD